MSVEEYLATSYRPDREWIDGRLADRNVGEYDHSNLQGALAAWLRNRARDWNIRALVSQRVRVTANRTGYRMYALSPDLGVDPVKRRTDVSSHGDFREPEDRVPETAACPIWIPLDELFADLD